MADKLVTIARFADSAQADLAKQLLDDFGIKSVVTGRNAIPAIADTQLQVLENQAQQAQEILESQKK
jgi:hypothetical protein